MVAGVSRLVLGEPRVHSSPCWVVGQLWEELVGDGFFTLAAAKYSVKRRMNTATSRIALISFSFTVQTTYTMHVYYCFLIDIVGSPINDAYSCKI